MVTRAAVHRLFGRFLLTTLFAVALSVSLNAATISFTFTSVPGMDGQLTYVDNPATNPIFRDFFTANIISPQFGNGNLSVPNDVTNLTNSTSHANLSIFTFSNGTFSGFEDSVINFMNGTAVVSYTITSGTGAFAGATGSVTEPAHFTSTGSFAPNVPATLAFTGSGTLTVSPEPGTIALLGTGFLGLAFLRKRLRKSA